MLLSDRKSENRQTLNFSFKSSIDELSLLYDEIDIAFDDDRTNTNLY
jgi:hypothetical protein